MGTTSKVSHRMQTRAAVKLVSNHLVFCGLLVRLEVRAGDLVVVVPVMRLMDGVQPGPPRHKLRQRQVDGAHVRASRRGCLRTGWLRS